MARGDKSRELGKRLDEIHTKLVMAHAQLQSEVDELDEILSPKLLAFAKLKEAVNTLDSINDDVEAIYSELDDVADELDSDEGDDESDKRQLEKDLATAQERIEELESENDDLSARDD